MAGLEAYSIDVDGMARFAKTLRKAGADVEDMKEANARAAQIVVREALTRVPARSGALRSTIRGNRAKGSARVMAGRVRVPYANVIHWGWPRRGIKSNPFLSDAAQATQPIWLNAYAQDLVKIYSKVQGA